MRMISWEEMQAVDANCQYFGLLPLQLMENAGAAIAREINASSPGKRIAIVAGRGNNGGDAFAAARHLSGFDVTVYLLGRSRDISTEEAKRNWNPGAHATDCGVRCRDLSSMNALIVTHI